MSVRCILSCRYCSHQLIRFQSTSLTTDFRPVRLTYNVYESDDELAAPKPLVIAHGLLGQKNNWKSVAKAMQRQMKNKVFAVDLRNHGDSPWTRDHTYEHMAADLELFITGEVLTRIPGCRSVTLLGHSMGGKTAALLALNNPQIIDRLIIEDIAPVPYKDLPLYSVPQYIKAMLNIKIKDFDHVVRSRHAVEKALEDVCPHEPTRKFLLTNLQDTWKEIKWLPNLEIINKNLDNVVGFPEIPKDAQFTGPTLAITGSESPFVTSEHRPVFEQLFPNVRFQTVQGSGHWIHADKPYDFMEIVSRFAILPTRLL